MVESRTRGKIKIYCKNCNVKFEIELNRIGINNFCSKSCSAICNNKLMDRSYLKKIKWAKCFICNKKIKTGITTAEKSIRCKDCKTTSPTETYRWKCKFNFDVEDYPEEFNLDLVNKYGWYCNDGNFDKVSKDHIISIKYAHKNNIDPKIIKHPANCKLILHKDNILKNDKNGMSIKELTDKIKKMEQ